MKGLLKRVNAKQAGFTLIELIVVIAILGVLAAIALPNFTGITTRGRTEAQNAELVTVQTAMDVMMANEEISTVTAANGVEDMSLVPVEHALYPEYLRSHNTTSTYDWTTSGLVTTNSTAGW